MNFIKKIYLKLKNLLINIYCAANPHEIIPELKTNTHHKKPMNYVCDGECDEKENIIIGRENINRVSETHVLSLWKNQSKRSFNE